jgi:hypothetical protein
LEAYYNVHKDDDVAFFALLHLHVLFNRMKMWECSLATITIPAGVVDWSRISMPPPVNHPWTCRKAPQGIPQLGERDEDGDASSDDDDRVDLEPVAELEDVGFLGDLDHLIDEGDWSEGEGQDTL